MDSNTKQSLLKHKKKHDIVSFPAKKCALGVPVIVKEKGLFKDKEILAACMTGSLEKGVTFSSGSHACPTGFESLRLTNVSKKTVIEACFSSS